MKNLKALGASVALAVLALVGGAGKAHADISTMTVLQSSKSGVTPTRTSTGLVASSRTYKARNDGKLFLLFAKTGAGTCTVTITTPGTVGGIAIADQTVTVDAINGDRVIGPLPTRIFNDSNGDIQFTLSDTVGLSMTAIKL